MSTSQPPPIGFEPCHRFDLFEPGDRTALVCLDVPEMQRIVISQLDELGYKVHTGLFLEDSVLKLRATNYNLVIVSEHFAGSHLEAHPVLNESAALPSSMRRSQVVVLLGASLSTNNEVEAFVYNVEVVVSLSDITNLKPILRRAVSRSEEFHAPLREILHAIHVEDRASLGAAVLAARV